MEGEKLKQFNTEEQKEICKLYVEERLSVVKISEKFHCRKEAISNVLRLNNIIIRGPGSNKKQIELSIEEEKSICELYAQGKSITFISKQTHHHAPVIKRILQKYNYEIEDRRGREKLVFSEE